MKVCWVSASLAHDILKKKDEQIVTLLKEVLSLNLLNDTYPESVGAIFISMCNMCKKLSVHILKQK